MTRPAGYYDVNYGQDMAIVRTVFHWWVFIAFLVLLAVLPFLLGFFMLRIVITMAIVLIAALGLQLLSGYTGLYSIGHSAFIGTGAYITGVLMNSFGWSYWLTIPVATLGTALIGVIIGLFSYRVKDFYLIVATLAFQFIFLAFILNFFHDQLYHGEGIPLKRPFFLGLNLMNETYFYYYVMPVTALMTFFARNIVRSRLGRAFVAIRDNDLSAEIMGINIFRYKLYAFAICSFYAGLAGSLWAILMRNVGFSDFVIEYSIWYLALIVLGGVGSIPGTVFGTIVLVGIKQFILWVVPILSTTFSPALAHRVGPGIGLLSWSLPVCIFLLFEPRGLAHTWEVLKTRFQNWPFTYGI